MTKQEFLNEQLNRFKGANEKVLEFIIDARLSQGKENEDAIRSFFTAGYCYYFAVMLREAFQSGTICYVADKAHIVFVDGIDLDNDYAYDIDGVFFEYGERDLIPIKEMERKIWDFIHKPGVVSGYDRSETDRLIHNWKHDTYMVKDQWKQRQL